MSIIQGRSVDGGHFWLPQLKVGLAYKVYNNNVTITDYGNNNGGRACTVNGLHCDYTIPSAKASLLVKSFLPNQNQLYPKTAVQGAKPLKLF